MNTPGTKEGNWLWQAQRADIEAAKDTMCQLVKLHQ
jgi:hypothetical protein